MISRRWVLRLGAGTVLSGFSGLAEEAPLPPGVYGPSLNHLAHALQAANAHSLAKYQPRFLTPAEFALMRRVVAVLLGPAPNDDGITDIVNWMDLTLSDSAEVRAAARGLSAQQRALAVAYFGAETVRALETNDPARVAHDGLRALANVDDLAGALTKMEGQPFYDWARQAAFDGYYTSREGLKELDYQGNAFYPESPGCARSTPTGAASS